MLGSYKLLEHNTLSFSVDDQYSSYYSLKSTDINYLISYSGRAHIHNYEKLEWSLAAELVNNVSEVDIRHSVRQTSITLKLLINKQTTILKFYPRTIHTVFSRLNAGLRINPGSPRWSFKYTPEVYIRRSVKLSEENHFFSLVLMTSTALATV